VKLADRWCVHTEKNDAGNNTYSGGDTLLIEDRMHQWAQNNTAGLHNVSTGAVIDILLLADSAALILSPSQFSEVAVSLLVSQTHPPPFDFAFPDSKITRKACLYGTFLIAVGLRRAMGKCESLHDARRWGEPTECTVFYISRM
jgi:hypothetical protein